MDTSVLNLAKGHLSTAFWEIARSIFVWGIVASILCCALYSLGKYCGITRIRGQVRRWANIAYCIVLFFIVLPIVAIGAGGITGICNATNSIVISEVSKNKWSRPLGTVLVWPMLLADWTATGNKIQDFNTGEADQREVSFLLDKERRKKATEQLTQQLLQDAFEKLKIEETLQKSKIGKRLWEFAKRRAVDLLEKKIEMYDDLFQKLEPQANGRLPYSEACDQVGNAFFIKHIVPYIQKPFHAIRLQILVIATGIWIFAILLIQVLGRWVIHRASKVVDSPETNDTSSK